MSVDFSRLHKSLQHVLDDRDWNPTAIQSLSMEDIIAGKDRILIAPTGSGKTLAGILPLFHRCLSEQWTGLSILYITPLRALNRDVDLRLSQIAEAVGLRVDTRHGDTSQSDRQKQARNPPHMLITTPETFQLMLSGKKLRTLLNDVQTVVVDEVHDIAASERGWQLRIGLERLDAFVQRPIQRLGLSATVGNPDYVAAWLSKNDCLPIIHKGNRETNIEVCASKISDEAERGAVRHALKPRQFSTYTDLLDAIENEPPCLVFVNSRNEAETLAGHLSALAPDFSIGVHHGSLAREVREQMENELRDGTLSALVCTSSLELGIDVGSIKTVLQLHSPKSSDRMLQRIGRADHKVGGVGNGIVFSWDVDHLAESSIISMLAMDGEIEPVDIRPRPITVALNQLVMMAHANGAMSIDGATKIIASSPQFESWTRDDTESILRILDEHWIVRFAPDPTALPWYRWPKALIRVACTHADVDENEMLDLLPSYNTADEDIPQVVKQLSLPLPKHLSKGWYSTAGKTFDWVRNNLSMIPNKRMYTVRDAVTRKSLGKVDEAFVLSLNQSGEDEDGVTRQFVIAGRTWIIVDADPEQSELLVAPIKSHGKAPVWVGEIPPVPQDVAQKVGRLRRLLADSINLEYPLHSTSGLDKFGHLNTGSFELKNIPLNAEGKGMLIEQIVKHVEDCEFLPSDECITIEERSEALVINCCQGSKINEALGQFLLVMASTITGQWGRVECEPTRISLYVGSAVQIEDLQKWLMETPPEAIENILSVTLPNSSQVRWRFAQVAKLFGILREGVDPRKINLNALLKTYRGTVVMEEVLGKLFFERMDVQGAQDLIEAIQSGVIACHLTSTGPLGISSRTREDMTLPNWDNAELRSQLQSRLCNERAALCCLKCHTTRRFRVARYHTMDKIQFCLSCGGRMLACAREGMLDMLEKWVASEDESDQDRMTKNADIVAHRGYEAILCLMGRGIGEATAIRILRKVTRGDEEGLLQAIHHAEVDYARTRRFWGN
jgi:ATP-dependent Lhr-like helicase